MKTKNRDHYSITSIHSFIKILFHTVARTSPPPPPPLTLSLSLINIVEQLLQQQYFLTNLAHQ